MEHLSVSVSNDFLSKGITVLAVKGTIDTTTAPDFEKSFSAVLDEKKFKLVVDLKDVDYVSSAGWGIFIGEIKRIRGQKGDLVLTGMNPEVLGVYELLDFNAILKSFPDVDSAVKAGFKRS